jgi:hypothetical protein
LEKGCRALGFEFEINAKVCLGAKAVGHIKSSFQIHMITSGVSVSDWNQWTTADRNHWPPLNENGWLFYWNTHFAAIFSSRLTVQNWQITDASFTQNSPQAGKTDKNRVNILPEYILKPTFTLRISIKRNILP